MKRKILLICLAVSVFAMAGCGKKDPEGTDVNATVEESSEPESESTEEESEEIVEESYLYPVIEEREVVNGEMQSYLSGEWVDEAIATRRPIAVSIPNQKSCLPHYGITNASVIYQVPLRDNLT